jgi:hypothetical protein
MNKFLKPHVPQPGLLEPNPGNPLGYVTNDGMWAAVPLGNTKKYVIIHQGSQVTTLNTYKQSVDFINNQLKTQKRKSRSSNVRKKRKTS